MQDSKYETKRSDLDLVRSMFSQNDIQSLMSNDEREKKVVIIPDHKPMGMMATKSMAYDVHMCDTMPAMVDSVMKKMNNIIYGESLFQKSTWTLFNNLCDGEYIPLYKEKNDNMFTIRAKLIKFYKTHKMEFTPTSLNKDAQELMTKKKIHIWV